MSLILLWIEMLAACVLFAATLITVGLRRKSRKAGMAIQAVGMLLPMVPLGWLLVLMAIAHFSVIFKSNAFWWALLLLACYVMGTGVARAKAAGRDEAGIRRADSWSVTRMVTMLLVVIALYTMTFWNMTLKALVEIQALRAEAGAMALSVVPPLVPDSENAARLYEQADEQYKAATAPEDEKVDYRELDSRSAEVTGYLERQRKALELLRRAADMPGYRPEYDFLQTDMDALLVAQEPLRRLANLLAVATKTEALGGNAELALADCRRMYALGAHANTPSMMINGMIAIAIDGLASKTALEVLPSVSAKAQLEPFAALDPRAPWRSMVRTLRGEEAYGLARFCEIGDATYRVKGATHVYVMKPIGGTAIWMWWLRDDVGFYRDAFDRYLKIAERPYYQTAAERKQIAEEFQPGKQHGLFTVIIAPQLTRCLETAAEAQAMREAVGVAFAATGYRLDHGTYPETVEALVPTFMDAIPLDPFDGKPLRFKKNDDGSVTIYSVGPDGKDDGGQIERTKTKPLDTGFTLRLPAKQG